jgi:hypothetical protein
MQHCTTFFTMNAFPVTEKYKRTTENRLQIQQSVFNKYCVMQFGKALQRVFTTLVHADPRYGPVYLAKIDVADGFYRVWLQLADVPKLGVFLPIAPGCLPLVAFPLALPMGWVESPPYFTILTETACDRANDMLSAHRAAPQQGPPSGGSGRHTSRQRQHILFAWCYHSTLYIAMGWKATGCRRGCVRG